MKKNLVLLSLAVLLLSGCTKNYNSVDGYYADMSLKNQKNAETGYKMEVSQSIPTAVQTNLYYRTYVKGNKWKTEVSMNGGISYMSTIIYDGQDVLSYAPGAPYAIANPFIDDDMTSDPDLANETINVMNPVYSLINWQNGYKSLFSMDLSDTKTIINNKDNKNGYDCRMISFTEGTEACVSDQIGLAVYMKSKYQEFNKKSLQEESKEVTMNLVSYEKINVSDSEFELPAGIKKMSIDNVLSDLDKIMGN